MNHIDPDYYYYNEEDQGQSGVPDYFEEANKPKVQTGVPNLFLDLLAVLSILHFLA